jgi:NAD(P)-dependent dehydrogenase (short-subunit alcohol dehydrogenase family)
MTIPAASTVSLVSGANKGIGLEIARGLARAGHHVLIGCRDAVKGDEACAALRAEGGRAQALALDVGDDSSIAAAAASIEERFGRLDVLVNNAGLSLDREIGASSLRAVMRATFEVNVFGIACLTEAMTPLLARSARPRIVNMSSGLGSLANNSDPDYEFAAVKMPAYNASKAAATMLTVVYAARLRDHGIKVNAADPGFCATDLNGHRGYRTAEQGAAIAIRLATLDDAGPSGGFFDETGAVPW